MFNFGGVLELGYLQLHVLRMRGFRQTKSQPAKPALCRKGVCRDQRCVCLGGGSVRRLYLFLPASSKQTTTWNSRAKASRGHGRGGRCVGRSPCSLLAAPAEPVSSEIAVSPALHGGNWSCCLAVSPVLWLFLGEREVAVFPKCRLSHTRSGLLGSFSQAALLTVLPTGKARVLFVSAFSFPIWNKGKLFKILFQFWFNLFS